MARARAQAAIAAANQAGTVTVSQILDGHVTLEVECEVRLDMCNRLTLRAPTQQPEQDQR